MSEIRKCKCGGMVVMVSCGPGVWQPEPWAVQCHECKRRGPQGRTQDEAIEQWNSDRLAEEEARSLVAAAESVQGEAPDVPYLEPADTAQVSGDKIIALRKALDALAPLKEE